MPPKAIIVVAPQFDGGGGIGAVSRSVLDCISRWKLRVHSMQGWAFQGTVANIQGDTTMRTFNGSKLQFVMALLLLSTRKNVLVLTTHVQLVRPLSWLPTKLRPRLVVIAHGSEATWRIRDASRRTFREAQLVLTNSKFTQHQMRLHNVDGNIQAWGLGLPIDAQPCGKPDNSVATTVTLRAIDGVERQLSQSALLLVGRMLLSEREKGHEQLIEVLPKLAQGFPSVQMVFVGTGDLGPTLVKRANALGVSDRVFLPGYVDRRNLEKIYKASCAFVMPSRQEGFGLVYLEAMNHGLACLACSADGGAEVVVAGKTGWHVENPDDLNALSDCLSEMLANPASLRERGLNGWKLLQQKYTAEHMCQRLRTHLLDFVEA